MEAKYEDNATVNGPLLTLSAYY